MRVPITGGTGFIGAEVVRQLVAEGGHAVRGLMSAARSGAWRTADRIALIRGDVGNFSHVLEAVKGAWPETIFQPGAILSPTSDLDRSAAMHANVNGTFNVL